MNTREITLDISKAAAVAPIVTIRQGDRNATTLKVAVYDNDAPLDLTGYTVRLCIKLPDNEHYYSVDGTAAGNIASFAIDETYAAAYPGRTDEAYMEVLYGSEVICSTQSFAVEIEPGAREGVEPGEMHLAEIDAVIAEVEALIDEIQEGAVFGVKGNAEAEYRTGSVNLTPANIGAADEAHAHAIADVTGLQDALDAKLDGIDVSISQTATGADVTVNGSTVSIANGTDGSDGADGYSPSASVERNQTGATITIEDEDGVTSATVYDGMNGRDGTNGRNGTDGITPEVEVTEITGGHNVAFDYGEGDPRNTDFDVMDGSGAVSGVKGDAESNYRTGNVNLTPANIGAAPSSHTHTEADITDLGDYLPLSGGTMTGSVIVKSSNIDRDGADPSSTESGNSFILVDKDSDGIGILRPSRQTDGRQDVHIIARNEDGSGNQVENGLRISVDKDGTCSYGLSSASAFRDAILAPQQTFGGSGTTVSLIQTGGNGGTTGKRMAIVYDETNSRIVVDAHDGSAWMGRRSVALWNGAANRVLATPNGSAGATSFRALEPADCSWLGTRAVKDQTSNVSVATATWVQIASVSLAAGSWVICGNLYFATNATGRRYACIHTTTPNAAAQRQRCASAPAISGGSTDLNVAVTVSITSSMTFGIWAYQNSGSALNVTGYINAMRIA